MNFLPPSGMHDCKCGKIRNLWKQELKNYFESKDKYEKKRKAQYSHRAEKVLMLLFTHFLFISY